MYPKGRIHIVEILNCNKLIHHVRPVYPAQAKNWRMEGIVRLRAIITKKGGLKDVQVVRGSPLLIPAALEAAGRWRYTPCLLNSEPVEVITTIDLDFNLSQ